MLQHTVESNGFKMTFFKNDAMATSSIGANTSWEPHLTNFVKICNKFFNLRNIIDVGANFGYHSMLFSKESSGNVYAFEPQIQNFELLQTNIKNNSINNIIPFNNACGDVECNVNMPIIQTNNSVNMGDFTPNVGCDPNNFSVIKSVVLDDMGITDIDLIKIDVQGWEKKVLIGAKNILAQYKPILIVEFEWFQLMKTNTTCKELFDFIRNNNYYIFYIEYTYQSDHICVHNDHLQEFRLKFDKYIFKHTENNGLNNNLVNGVVEKIVMP